MLKTLDPLLGPDLLHALATVAPSPRAQPADKRVVAATETGMSAFVFKIQANMDPNHRDRIAFVRLCSGTLTRGSRTKRPSTGSRRSPARWFWRRSDRPPWRRTRPALTSAAP